MSKSIIPLDPVDIGGVQPHADELISDEELGYLKTIKLNDALLGDDDPFKDEYTRFLSEITNSPQIIKPEDIDVGESGDVFDVAEFDKSSEINFNKYIDIVNNSAWASAFFNAPYLPPLQYDSDNMCDKIKVGGNEFVMHNYDYESSVISNVASIGVA